MALHRVVSDLETPPFSTCTMVSGYRQVHKMGMVAVSVSDPDSLITDPDPAL
jgi:hypothetical protein